MSIEPKPQKPYLASVDVMTWNTQSGITPAFANALMNEINGGNEGHAALLIRAEFKQSIFKKLLAANIPFKIIRDENKMMPDGTIGTEDYLEIYWSFWPNTHSFNELHHDIFNADDEDSLDGQGTPSIQSNQSPTPKLRFYLEPEMHHDFMDERQGVHVQWNEELNWNPESRVQRGRAGQRTITLGPLLVQHQRGILQLPYTPIEASITIENQLDPLLKRLKKSKTEYLRDITFEDLEIKQLTQLINQVQKIHPELKTNILSTSRVIEMLSLLKGHLSTIILVEAQSEYEILCDQLQSAELLEDKLNEQLANSPKQERLTLTETQLNIIKKLSTYFGHPYSEATISLEDWEKLIQKTEKTTNLIASNAKILKKRIKSLKSDLYSIKKGEIEKYNGATVEEYSIHQSNKVTLSKIKDFIKYLESLTNDEKNSLQTLADIQGKFRDLGPNAKSWGLGFRGSITHISKDRIEALLLHLQAQEAYLSKQKAPSELENCIGTLIMQRNACMQQRQKSFSQLKTSALDKLIEKSEFLEQDIQIAQNSIRKIKARIDQKSNILEIIAKTIHTPSIVIEPNSNSLDKETYKQMETVVKELIEDPNILDKTPLKLGDLKEKIRLNIMSYFFELEKKLIKETSKLEELKTFSESKEHEMLSAYHLKMQSIESELESINELSILRQSYLTNTEQHLTVGTAPSNIVTLTGMDLDKMIAQMQKITSNQESTFELYESNCSMTCAEILASGAPVKGEIFKNKAYGAVSNPQQLHNNALSYSKLSRQIQDDNWIQRGYHSLSNSLLNPYRALEQIGGPLVMQALKPLKSASQDANTKMNDAVNKDMINRNRARLGLALLSPIALALEVPKILISPEKVHEEALAMYAATAQSNSTLLKFLSTVALGPLVDISAGLADTYQYLQSYFTSTDKTDNPTSENIYKVSVQSSSLLSPSQKITLQYIEIESFDAPSAIALMREKVKSLNFNLEIPVFSKETQSIINNYLSRLTKPEQDDILQNVFSPIQHKAQLVLNGQFNIEAPFAQISTRKEHYTQEESDKEQEENNELSKENDYLTGQAVYTPSKDHNQRSYLADQTKSDIKPPQDINDENANIKTIKPMQTGLIEDKKIR